MPPKPPMLHLNLEAPDARRQTLREAVAPLLEALQRAPGFSAYQIDANVLEQIAEAARREDSAPRVDSTTGMNLADTIAHQPRPAWFKEFDELLRQRLEITLEPFVKLATATEVRIDELKIDRATCQAAGACPTRVRCAAAGHCARAEAPQPASDNLPGLPGDQLPGAR